LSDQKKNRSVIYDQIPGKNVVKIGPVDPEIALLKNHFFKSVKRRKKLTQAKHISCRAGMLRGLNKLTFRLLDI